MSEGETCTASQCLYHDVHMFMCVQQPTWHAVSRRQTEITYKDERNFLSL